MKLARYWTRAQGEAEGRSGPIRVTSRGWSNDSLQAARAVARDNAQRVAEKIASNHAPSQRYPYGDRPLPEPVLREFQPDRDGPAAVVTRNVYGSTVLNTRDLMFVDIDKEEKPYGALASGLASGFRSLFGKPAPAQTVLTEIQAVAERNSLTVRAYKTAAGYRVLITNRAFEAGEHRTEDLLSQFSADPLYVRLCRMQESFRARLTPKPWRCGLSVPPVTFPFETPEATSRFQNWERDYTSAIQSYATCRYMASFGSSPMASGFEELVQYHDQETRAASLLPLA
ncbi:MAG TPA: hypothetical protein VN841_14515 [Bryobacteraceae bacterium]|nr:hypothetical protein [Bryobacteraceae bacterium]